MSEKLMGRMKKRVAGISIGSVYELKSNILRSDVDRAVGRIGSMLHEYELELVVSEEIRGTIGVDAKRQLFLAEQYSRDILKHLLDDTIDVLWYISRGFGAFQIVAIIERLRNDKDSEYYHFESKFKHRGKYLVIPAEATVLQNYFENLIAIKVVRYLPLDQVAELSREVFGEDIKFLMNDQEQIVLKSRDGIRLLNYPVLDKKDVTLSGKLLGGSLDQVYFSGGQVIFEEMYDKRNILYFDIVSLREWPYFGTIDNFFASINSLRERGAFDKVQAIIFGDILPSLKWPSKPEYVGRRLYRKICSRLEFIARQEVEQIIPDFNYVIRDAYKLIKEHAAEIRKDPRTKLANTESGQFVVKVAEYFVEQISFYQKSLHKFAEQMSIPVFTGFPASLKDIFYNKQELETLPKGREVLHRFLQFDCNCLIEVTRNPVITISNARNLQEEHEALNYRKEYIIKHQKDYINHDVHEKYLENAKTIHEYNLIGIQPANNFSYSMKHIEGEVIGGNFSDIVNAILNGEITLDNKHVILKEDEVVASSPFRFPILNMQFGFLHSIGVLDNIKSFVFDFIDENEDEENLRSKENELRDYIYHLSNHNGFTFPIYMIREALEDLNKTLFHGSIDIEHAPLIHYLTSITFNEEGRAYKRYLLILTRIMSQIKGRFSDRQKKEIVEIKIEEKNHRLLKAAKSWEMGLRRVDQYIDKFYNNHELIDNGKQIVDAFYKHINSKGTVMPIKKLMIGNEPTSVMHLKPLEQIQKNQKRTVLSR